MLSGCHGYSLAGLPCACMESSSLTIQMENPTDVGSAGGGLPLNPSTREDRVLLVTCGGALKTKGPPCRAWGLLGKEIGHFLR